VIKVSEIVVHEADEPFRSVHYVPVRNYLHGRIAVTCSTHVPPVALLAAQDGGPVKPVAQPRKYSAQDGID
jgi:hypothetical protein